MTAPAYSVPSMAEVRAIEPNGFVAASSFSGCGGSSLGYRLAGFRVAWASEFVAAAADTYRANASPETVLDTRDIREVTGAEILEGCGLKRGELDLFDGSPPCSSFSTAGKRHKGWGEVNAYSDTAQRTDDLFGEYARLVGELAPRTFVAENVAGLIKGVSKGYFLRILAMLRAAGYSVEARVLDAAWLGVPQSRRRLIFVGVRDDLGKAPAFPSPLTYRYSVADVLPHILAQGDNGPFAKGTFRAATQPSPTIMAGTGGNGAFPPEHVIDAGEPVKADPETGAELTVERWANGSARAGRRGLPNRYVRDGAQPRRLTLGELRVLASFPPDFTLTGTYAQRWERIGRAVPPLMACAVAEAIRDHVLIPLREGGAI